MIDGTILIYFAFYDPLVYVTFLHNYLRNKRGIVFNQNVVEYPETSDECYKTYSNVTNATSQNQFNQFNCSVNQQQLKAEEYQGEMDDQLVEDSTHFYPDNLITLDRNNDDYNINQIMKNYNIISEGAQMEYTNRLPSSTFGGEASSPDEKEKSIILSLSDEIEPQRRGTWNLSDFVSH